jgi:hypothetical protein
MTHYGDMAQRTLMGDEALADTIRHDTGLPLPSPDGRGTCIMQVRISRDGMCWLGRVWDESGEQWYWIPLPYTTMASYKDVEDEMMTRGIITLFADHY